MTFSEDNNGVTVTVSRRVWSWVDAEAEIRAAKALAASAEGRKARVSETMARVLLCMADADRAPFCRFGVHGNTLHALVTRNLITGYYKPDLTDAGRALVAGYDIDGDYRPTAAEVKEREDAAYARYLEREKTRDKRLWIASKADCGCNVGFAAFDSDGAGAQADKWRRQGLIVALFEADAADEQMRKSFGCKCAAALAESQTEKKA